MYVVCRILQGHAIIIKQLWLKCRLHIVTLKCLKLESRVNMQSVHLYEVVRSFLFYFVDLGSYLDWII